MRLAVEAGGGEAGGEGGKAGGEGGKAGEESGAPRHIRGSPFRVFVSPDVTSAKASAISWEWPAHVGEKQLVVGQTLRLRIQSRDRYFNTRPFGGDRFALHMRLEPGSCATTVVERDVVIGEVDDRGDGSYTATVTTTIAACYRVLLVLMPPPPSLHPPSNPTPFGALAPPKGAHPPPVHGQLSGASPRKCGARQPAAAAAAAGVAVGGAPAAPATVDVAGGQPGRPSLDSGRRPTESIPDEQLALEHRMTGLTVLQSRVVFLPGATHAPSCLVSGEGLWQSDIFQRATFLIQS